MPSVPIDIPSEKHLVAQLSGRRFKVVSKGKGRIQIESKEDMKKRGLKSPDHADALALAIKARSMVVEDDDGAMLTVI